MVFVCQKNVIQLETHYYMSLLYVFPSYAREIVLETFLFPKYLPLKATTTGIIGIILSIVDLKQITYCASWKKYCDKTAAPRSSLNRWKSLETITIAAWFINKIIPVSIAFSTSIFVISQKKDPHLEIYDVFLAKRKALSTYFANRDSYFLDLEKNVLSWDSLP